VKFDMLGPSALRACALLLICLWSACGKDNPRSFGEGTGATACSGGADCVSGLCVEVAPGRAVCTGQCDPENPTAACPDVPNWHCGKPHQLGVFVCLCQSDSALEICGDGKDNDCNGFTDDCALCGDELVARDDPQHCGACFRSCRGGASCSDGVCQCPPGSASEDCTREPDAPECSKAEHCDDGIACSEDSCVQGSCQHAVVPARCKANEVCDLRKQGCVAGKACAKDADCADGDPCTSQERCDPPTRVCLWQLLDGDGDGVPPRVCGGSDCNDAERLTYPGAPELCDGTDNSCDGVVDTPLSETACTKEQSCMAGVCLCLGGKTECASGCVDLDSDAQNCGACSVRCARGAECTARRCACPAGREECGLDGCVDVSADPKHCGRCGRSCEEGSSCKAGQCVDVDECALNLHQCGAHALCVNRAAGYGCVCAAGYTSAPGQLECVDIDECSSGQNDCFPGACVDSEGGFTCTCPAGYSGDGRSCTNINECESVTCSGHGVCQDTPGSYSCSCDRGYVADGMGGCVVQDACAAGLEAGKKWCDGACTDIRVNPNHCGDCNSACGVGGSCSNGVCTCAGGRTFCPGAGCVSLSDDVQRCGMCTRSCPGNGGFCVSGECFCPPDTKACNGACAALGTTLNCSDCDVRCAAGASCNPNRQCVCPAGTPDVCAATCVAKQTNPLHCGECGRACPSGASCTGGSCLCPPGQEACQGSCVNKQTSTTHCGTCERGCPIACSIGACATAIAVKVGFGFSCAILSDGRVRCWGDAAMGRLGNIALTGAVQVPTPVASITGASKLSLSADHACVLTTAGAVYCWGSNWYRESDPNSASGMVNPTLVGSGYAQLAVGNSHVCAQTSVGAIVCWGSNEWGQRGVAGIYFEPTTVPTATLGSVDKLVAGGDHTCALKQGTIYCWGSDSWGQIGVGSATGAAQLTPVVVPGLSNVSDIALGGAHTCAVSTGSVYCWGYGGYGQLGNGSSQPRVSPTLVPGISTAVAIHAGASNSCAVLADKSIVCWGEGGAGQLGQGSFVGTYSANATVSGGASLTGLAMGLGHACAITSTGNVACWGDSGSYATTFSNPVNTPQSIAW
jgi:alpha-tubulin suppressor-like RCC1 family protein